MAITVDTTGPEGERWYAGEPEQDFTRRLAEALRELLSADPNLPSYADAVAEAENLVAEAEKAGILEPT